MLRGKPEGAGHEQWGPPPTPAETILTSPPQRPPTWPRPAHCWWGIDSVNLDDTADPRRPAHSLLLAAGIGSCEHLTNLGSLPAAGFRFSAVPPKIAGFGTFPVRAYASWPDPVS
jgi:hypothetical protein